MFFNALNSVGIYIKPPQPKQEWNDAGTEIIEHVDGHEEHWLEVGY
jgi:hypothetical protein